MLYRALKMWFWVTYDHLGQLIVLNACAMVPAALLTGLAWAFGGPEGMLGLFLLYGVALPAYAAALGHFARVLIDKREAPLREFLRGLRQFGAQGALLGGAFSAGIVLSFVGAYYYLFVLARPAPVYAYLLAAVCLWCGALLGVIYAMALPALAQKRAGIREAARTGALLAADNPVYGLVITLHLLGLAVFSITLPIYLLISIAPMAVLQATAYEMLARKYAAPLIDGKRTLTFDDAQDEYLNRGLRDFFFPWKL